MTTFNTFTQFDKRFKDFGKFDNDRSACPLFGIITCYNFMSTGLLTKKQHEQNIYASVMNYILHDVPKYMSFDELLLFCTKDLANKEIGATSPELITTGVLSYEHIFKFGSDQNYCVLFLKNRNYIPVLCSSSKSDSNEVIFRYSIRDCHENSQKNFNNFESLRQYLDKTYQFEQLTIVDGVTIAEFSNIEYIVIDSPFIIHNIDPELFDQSITFEDEKEELIADSVSTNSYVVTQTDKPKIDDYVNSDFQLALSLEGLQDNQEDDYVNFI